MNDDEIPRGRILARREALELMSEFGLSFLAGFGEKGSEVSSFLSARPISSAVPTAIPIYSSAACVVRPVWVPGSNCASQSPRRSDIRADSLTREAKKGVLLHLTFNVSRLVETPRSGKECCFLPDAQVELWHADAEGVYSGDENHGTQGQNFLRGHQITNSGGIARFTTIYPGCYEGRAVHLHFRIRSALGIRHYEFNSQAFFDDALTDSIYAQAPYNERPRRSVRNSDDGIYCSDGNPLLLLPTPTSQGTAATINIALDL